MRNVPLKSEESRVETQPADEESRNPPSRVGDGTSRAAQSTGPDRFPDWRPKINAARRRRIRARTEINRRCVSSFRSVRARACGLVRRIAGDRLAICFRILGETSLSGLGDRFVIAKRTGGDEMLWNSLMTLRHKEK